MQHDHEFHRLIQRERMAAIRAEYQRVQAPVAWPAVEAAKRYVQTAWSRMRWIVARRAPVFRA